jgi:hypothetical protein
MYKKIDLMVKTITGEWYYLCSTNQHKTCKEALARFLERYNHKVYQSTCGDFRINHNVKAAFSKS